MSERAIHKFDPNRALFEMQYEWGEDFARESGDFISMIGEDDQRFPPSLRTHVEGAPVPPDVVDGIANGAPAPVIEMREQMKAQEEETKWIGMAGDLLAAGHDVAIVTNHTDLPDIAYAQALITTQIARQQAKLDPNFSFSRGVVINGMVEFMEFKLSGSYMSGVQALQLLESDIYFSFPRTPSTERRIAEKARSEDQKDAMLDAVDGHNKAMRRKIMADLYRKNMLLAVAASGTTDEVVHLPDDHDMGTTESGLILPKKQIHMAKAGDGTAKMLTGQTIRGFPNAEVYILPVGLYYERIPSEDPEEPDTFEQVTFKVAAPPMLARNEMSIHYAMSLIADTLTVETNDDTGFFYPEVEAA